MVCTKAERRALDIVVCGLHATMGCGLFDQLGGSHLEGLGEFAERGEVGIFDPAHFRALPRSDRL
jgi:hypothetical protein